MTGAVVAKQQHFESNWVIFFMKTVTNKWTELTEADTFINMVPKCLEMPDVSLGLPYALHMPSTTE